MTEEGIGVMKYCFAKITLAEVCRAKEKKERLKAEKVAACEDAGWARLSSGSEKHEVSENEWKNQQDLVINWILGWRKQTQSFSATGRIKRRKQQF